MKLPRFAILTAFVFTMALPVAALKAESNVPYTRKYFPILKTQPVYPPEALAQGIEGYVIVRFDVTERGFAGNVTVYEESPEGVFGEAAVQAAQNYRYLPGRKDGENVAVSGVRSRVLFTLPNSADREGSEYGLVTQDELEVALSDDNMLDWHLVTQAIYDAKGERTRRQSILTGIMLEAEALAERTGNGDGLISAAALATAWRDVGWATYCLMRATEYRLSKPELLRYQLAPLYWQIGRFDDAKVLFIEDADSNEYDKQWLKYLDGEKRRRSVVYDALVSTLSAVVQN